MLKLQFKLLLRFLLKEKFYTVIHVVGLALGLASALVIYQYIDHETHYDLEHPNADQIYRVNESAIWVEGQNVMSSTPIPLADALRTEFATIEATTRINTPGEAHVAIEKEGLIKKYVESNVLAADSNFFDFFAFPLQYGDPETALLEKNSVVLSPSAAERYFGRKDVLGETILYGEGNVPVVVTGITKEQPTTVHFNFDLLFSMHTNPNIKRFEWSWIWTQMVTYAKLPLGADIDKLEQGMKGIAFKYAQPSFQRLGMDLSAFEEENGKLNFYLQPVADIHLGSEAIGNRIGKVGDKKTIHALTFVLVIILMVACINFIILTTSRSGVRIKEIGVKKVLGGSKKLMMAFTLLETIILCYVSMFIALGLSELFKIFVFGEQGVPIDFSSDFVGFSLLVPIVIGVLAGLYPAFVLNVIQPIHAFKQTSLSTTFQSKFNGALITIQFAISAILIFYALFIHDQLEFFNSKDLGFNRSNVMVLRYAHKMDGSSDTFKDAVAQIEGVQLVSASNSTPAKMVDQDFFFKKGQPDSKFALNFYKVDAAYLPLYQHKLLRGSGFTKDNQADHLRVVLNESAVYAFGYTLDNAIGQYISYYGETEYEIVGVIQDFHYFSLREEIGPFGFFHVDGPMFGPDKTISLRFDTTDQSTLIDAVRTVWASRTDAPFVYSFLTDDLAFQYRNDKEVAFMTQSFAVLAVLIGCVGLIGIASYNTERKRKEIGVRKVLGASVSSIFIMMSRQVLLFVLLGSMIGVPISFYLSNRWTESLPYSAPVDWMIFVLGIATLTAVSWSVIGFQTIKASLDNPIKSLKEE